MACTLTRGELLNPVYAGTQLHLLSICVNPDCQMIVAQHPLGKKSINQQFFPMLSNTIIFSFSFCFLCRVIVVSPGISKTLFCLSFLKFILYIFFIPLPTPLLFFLKIAFLLRFIVWYLQLWLQVFQKLFSAYLF